MGSYSDVVDICFHGLRDTTPLVFTVTNTSQRSPSKATITTRRAYRFTPSDSTTFTTDTYIVDTTGHFVGPLSMTACSDATLSLTVSSVNQAGGLNVRVTTGNRLLGKATFRYTITYFPGHQIWDGTDDFVNVCINNGLTVYSSEERLYCWSDDIYRGSLHRVWRQGHGRLVSEN
jgi:hypothetical protein